MIPSQETPCRIPCRPSEGPLCAYCANEDVEPPSFDEREPVAEEVERG